MGTPLLDDEFNQYWLKLSSKEKESLLTVAKHFVELKEENGPIGLEEYNKEIDEEMSRMDNGEFITHEEVVKSSQSWSNGE
jgi:predicted transcriptional regulator